MCMKTIFVVYTEQKLDLNDSATKKIKKYAFNTEEDLKEGDMLKSPNYDTPMMVVRVLDTSFKYYSHVTGELFDEINSTHCYDIRTLVIRTDDSNVVYAQKIGDANKSI